MPINIDEIITDKRYKLFSFDLFDTLISRKSGDHRSIFLLLGKELQKKGLITISAERFARQRDIFETRARRNNNWQEIQFRDIYDEMFLSLGLGGDVLEIMKEEMRIEAEQICAIPGVHEMLAKVRDRFGKVIFASDMYLPHTFLENHITELNIFKPGDTLYLSSEFGLQKRHGLFKIILEKENLSPSQLFHFGDSPLHEVKSAKSESIGVRHCTYAIEHPSEKILNGYSFQTDVYTSLMAGSSRFARLKAGDLSGNERTTWNTGASVTGPLVFLFAQWIIQQALQKGIKQLCFLARDAYFPYKAVQILLEQQPDIDLDTRYIYGSRFTYNALDIEKISAAEWEKLTKVSGYQYKTLSDLQTALYCEKNQFSKHLKELGFGKSDWDRVLSAQELGRVKHHALSGKKFNRDILQGVQKFQKLVLDHFKNEGDDSRGMALVDAGWTTKSHAPLYNFLKKSGFENVRLFYIGLTARETKIPADVVDTFIFNNAYNRGINRQNVYYNRPVEVLMMANHGRTRSFKKVNGTVEAVLDPVENAEFIENYFELYEKGIEAFFDEMSPNFEWSSPCHDHRSVAEELIARFWRNPTEDEARLWSKLDWEYDPLGKKTYPLAKPYRFKDAWSAFKLGRTPDLYSQFWRGGAEKITSQKEMYVIQKAISVRNFYSRAVRSLPDGIKKGMTKLGGRIINIQS